MSVAARKTGPLTAEATRAASLDALLRPASVAVVGASDNPERIGGRPIAYLRRYGFTGPVWGVNPKYTRVQGEPCVPQVGDLPEGIDLYIFAIPAKAVPDALEAACLRGARAATIFSGGFAEAGASGAALQRRISELARAHGVAVNGPNCLGVMSFEHRNFATFSTALTSLSSHEHGPVAVVSQSGGFATNLCVEAGLVGARFSHVITTGNEAGMTFSDYLEFLSRDEGTTAVLGYVEGIEDGWRLARALQLLHRVGKPVYLTKVGRTRAGAGVVATHTALASGVDSSYDAIFQRYGVTRLHTIDELIDVARAHTRPARAGTGLVVATISGGTAAYIADACDALGVRLPELSEATRTALVGQVPDFAFSRNPVDITAQLVNDLPTLRRALDTLSEDPSADEVLLFLGGQQSQASAIIGELVEAKAQRAGKLSVAWLGIPEEIRRVGRQRGLDIHGDPIRFLQGVAARNAALPGIATVPSPDGTVPGQPTHIAGPAETDFVEHEGRQALDEWHTLRLIDAAGLTTPARMRVSDAVPFDQAAERVGFPCVLKLLRPFIAHRSAVGAVTTGIDSLPRLRDAWAELRQRHRAVAGLLEAQAAGGLELIVGALRDPSFDARIVVSAGGVDVDSVANRVTIVPPFDADLVRDELTTLPLWNFAPLAGLTAGEALNLAVDATVRIGAAFLALRDRLDEIECNPIILNARGATVVDALAFGEGGTKHE